MVRFFRFDLKFFIAYYPISFFIKIFNLKFGIWNLLLGRWSCFISNDLIDTRLQNQHTDTLDMDMTSLPTPFNVEVPRELSSYVGAPQTSTLKGERRKIISYTS